MALAGHDTSTASSFHDFHSNFNLLMKKSKAVKFHGRDSEGKGKEICCRILVKLQTATKISIIVHTSRTYSKILRLQSSTSLFIY